MMQLLLDNYQPKRPYATNDYSAGLYQRDLETALTMKHIETAPKAYQNVICVDLDTPDAARFLQDTIGDEKIAVPNFLVENPDTTHAHAVWLLAFGASSERTQQFAKDIRTKMTIAAGGDLAYNNRTMRNPLLHPTQILTDHLYTFEELNAMVKDVQLPKRNTDGRANPDMLAHGRNTKTFELLRHFAYANWYAYASRDNMNGYQIAVTEKAYEINATHEQALAPAEIDATVRSVMRFVGKHFSMKDFKAIQSHRGVKSGNARREMARLKYVAVKEHMAVGFSQKEACEVLELNYTSVRTSFKNWQEMFDN
jgi:hypothetical protein